MTFVRETIFGIATSDDQRDVPAVVTRDVGAYEYGATLPVFTFATATSTVPEGTIDYPITITATGTFLNDVTVGVQVIGGSAASGTDYVFSSPTTLVFPAAVGPGSQFITLDTILDGLDEFDENAQFQLVILSGSGIVGTPDQHTMTIPGNLAPSEEPPPGGLAHRLRLQAARDRP